MSFWRKFRTVYRESYLRQIAKRVRRGTYTREDVDDVAVICCDGRPVVAIPIDQLHAIGGKMQVDLVRSPLWTRN